jgi:hypothetical protein
MSRSTMLAFVVSACALAALGSPLEPAPATKPKLPFTTRINGGKTGRTNGVSHIVEADRARVAHIKIEAAARKAATNTHGLSKRASNERRGTYSINAANAVVRRAQHLSLLNCLTD